MSKQFFPKRGAGVNIPIFSLRSKKSFGIGELLDLKLLIDWAKEAGLTLIQILPVNDTSMTFSAGDAYPYSMLSSFAIHPIYIHLKAIAPLDEALESEIDTQALQLNLPRLDYEQTFLKKMGFLKRIFQLYGKQHLSSKAFEAFFKKNGHWLKNYAAFCVLRDRFKTSDFRTWESYSTFSEAMIEKICRSDEVHFSYFVQFHLDKQFKEVVHYAKEQGILLKGDFPMGVHPNSVDAWCNFPYFRWHKSMGAPPDFYNDLGQNWGFPPYDWEIIKKDGFKWLKLRLKWMEQYFDMVRLDHVLGYFRLWEIPTEQVRGLMGIFHPSIPYSSEELAKHGLKNLQRLTEPYGETLQKGLQTQEQIQKKVHDKKERNRLFTQIENRVFLKDPDRDNAYHPRIDLKSTTSFQALDKEMQKSVLELFRHYYLEKQEDLWREKGREKLIMMQKSTHLFICAEDIGVIPNCVEELLQELKMFNLYVQRMPKSFDIEYENPKDFPKSCVCTPSNHDTATLREWWEEKYDATTRYYQQILGHEGNPPKQCTEEIAEEIIRAHIDSPAQLAIFLLQDLLAMSDALKFPNAKAERINDPAHPEGCWLWRTHLYLEELLLVKSFTGKIRKMLKKANR